MILDTFPTAEDFYKTYWGKRPFIVRGYIAPDVIESLIDAQTLAGLALEDEIKSRLITNDKGGKGWACEHGPIDESRFAELGDKNWSILVQNVEQYNKDTAKLLTHFQMSPRWLLDDIMISYSAPGGSVGPHTDSYHTFLVQGIGKRIWKISDKKIKDDRYVDNEDMKILEHGFEGTEYEVNIGDVIYMPPFFGHEGRTIEAAMTFSVGFLGPQLSDILSEFALYLEENEELNKRFLAEDLTSDSAGFTIGTSTQNVIMNDVISAIQSNDFAIWMASYFSSPTHEEIEEEDEEDEDYDGVTLSEIEDGEDNYDNDNYNEFEDEYGLTPDDILNALSRGETIYQPDHVKISITNAPDGGYNVAMFGDIICVSSAQKKLIEKINQGIGITMADFEKNDNKPEALALLSRGALSA